MARLITLTTVSLPTPLPPSVYPHRCILGTRGVHWEPAILKLSRENMAGQHQQTRKFTDEEFKNQLLHKLDEHRKANILCDTTLRAEGQEFPAHRCILSAASDYFKALFSSELQVKENQDNFVELSEVKSTVLAEVLQFIYTGEVNIGSQNAQDLVMVSDYLIIPSLKTKASQFLEESITASNCLALESFASQYNCESLRVAVVKYKSQNFVAFVKSENYLSLGVEQVKELMCQDDLQISEEEEVYEAMITWVKHDLSSRECLLSELLKCLRLFSMSKYSLRMILDKEELIKKTSICTSILTKGLDFFLFPDQFLGVSLKHRTSIEKEEHVVVITAPDPLDEDVKCFVLATKKWRWLTHMPDSLVGEDDVACASAVCGGQLYLLALSSADNSTTTYCYNPQENRWKSRNTDFPGSIRRTVTSCNEHLYLIGGEQMPHDVIRYNPIQNTWKKLAPMETARVDHCAVVLGDLIYVIAGLHGEVSHQSVESYNQLTDQWTKMPDLCKARRCASAAATCGKILVVGGYCERTDTNNLELSCEVFDPCLNQWSLVASPIHPRTGCAIVSVDESVYIFGGENRHIDVDAIEVFDAKSNEWHEVPGAMTEGPLYAQASLLRLPKKSN